MIILPVVQLCCLCSWSFLEVTTSSQYNDSIQAYAAGAVEAAVTSQVSIGIQAFASMRVIYLLALCLIQSTNLGCVLQLIYKHWMNTLMGYCGPFTSQSGYCERLKVFIASNLQWVQEQLEKQKNSPYWYQVTNRSLWNKWNPLLECKNVEKPEK